MSIEVLVKKEQRFVEPFDIARRFIKLQWEDYKLLSVLIAGLAFVFPPLGFAVATGYLWWFYERIWKKYFEDYELRAFYEREWKPKITKTQYLQVGYEVYPSELYQHLKVVENLLEEGKEQKEAVKILSGKAKYYRVKEPWRIVGYSVKTLPTHKWIIGTTGAGKTSYIMQGFLKQFEQGGGVIFVDGKGDIKGAMKFIKLAEKAGRLNDILILNFLTADEYKAHTNTYNFVLVFPPAVLIELLDSLLPSTGGDGEYWKGRGVSLMRALVFAFDFRKRFWNEPFSYETLRTYREVKPFTILASAIFSLALLENERLKKDKNIAYLISQAKKILQAQTEFPELELIAGYLKQNPSIKEDLNRAGYNTDYIESLWETLGYFQTWIPSISDEWKAAILLVAKKFVEIKGEQIKDLSLSDFLELYRKVEQQAEKDRELADFKDWIKNPQGANPDAMQQHLYAMQQWDKPFSIFQQYSHIFGALQSDVDFEDVIKNNKLLYVVLPPLKQSEETTMFLGRLIIMSIRQATAKALGGAVELTKRQAQLLTARITPNPPFLIVLDEYGAYPVEGIDTILAQVRSINVSTWIATQDFTSGRVKGERKEEAVLRMWANTNIKVLMKNLDKEVIQILRDYLPKVKAMQKTAYVYDDEVFFDTQVSLNEQGVFDEKMLEAFKNGLSFIVGEGRWCISQIEYADTEPVEHFTLNRLESLTF
jgi:hypothetical protein